ncbi:hypothetical protein BX600DRAFT_498572 [Xylariales sp. PMI_506]|nr:hypothetical protein BX600DRAFT_498572 [Xylariales sp. PMI_506]
MAGDRILVLGATGPAGICLLRELVHRKHSTIAYVRNPSKIPSELASSPILEVVKGEITETESLSTVISRSYLIISLLGPNDFFAPKPYPYPGYYTAIFPLMREHGVKRIMAMSTVSADEPGDRFHLVAFLLVLLVRIMVPAAYRAVRDIVRVFKEEAGDDLDWTVFRLGAIPGAADEESWRAHRGDITYAGALGGEGWKVWLRRSALARWLVDMADGGQDQWIHKVPAVSNLSDSKSKDD